MAEVLIGQSYSLRFDPKLWRLMQPYPPLGAMLAAACLRRANHEVALFDSMLAESEQDWEAALERHRPQVAVLFEDHWFYIPQSDHQSKKSFGLLEYLFQMQAPQTPTMGPLLTVPTG